MHLAKNLGNIYTGSLYNGLLSLVCNRQIDLSNKKVLMFSYGSGCAASMFILRVAPAYKQIQKIASFDLRLQNRVRVSAEEYDRCMSKREQLFGKADYTPNVSKTSLFMTQTYLFCLVI